MRIKYSDYYKSTQQPKAGMINIINKSYKPISPTETVDETTTMRTTTPTTETTQGRYSPTQYLKEEYEPMKYLQNKIDAGTVGSF